MKTIAFLLAAFSIVVSVQQTCSAQPPQWVTDLVDEVFTLDIGSFTNWGEQQMTWYNINGQVDQSDSVSVNTLLVRGTTTSGQHFLAAIPVQDKELNPLGTRGITGQTCSGECGCQRCEFKKDSYGCQDCLDCQSQQTCTCWCKHTITRN